MSLVQLSLPPLPSLTALKTSVLRQFYLQNPDKWIEDKLSEFVWSKQREILFSVRDHRRTAVPSCHGPGKSWIASRIIAHFLDCHPPGSAIAVTTAPTGNQVRNILWRELNRAHAKAHLFGRMNQVEWWAEMPDGHEELIAFGRKPADYNASGFSGIHGKFVLVVVDEACGINRILFDSLDSLLANENSRILAIGNPEDPTSEFYECCRPGSGWNVIHISAFDTPNFTGEYIPDELKSSLIHPIWQKEKLKKWGEDNPLYIAKVLGQFPELSERALIPLSSIRAARDRRLKPTLPIHLGVDVSGGGGNKSVVAVRKGPVVRLKKRIRTPNTQDFLDAVLQHVKNEEAEKCKVDYIGIGRGMVDQAYKLARDKVKISDGYDIWRYAKVVRGINVSLPSVSPKEFANVRAHAYWSLRDLFVEDSIDIPNDEDLLAQLADIRWSPENGRIQIESKKEMRKRGRQSPDELDAVMLAFLNEAFIGKGAKKSGKLTWGRMRE